MSNSAFFYPSSHIIIYSPNPKVQKAKCQNNTRIKSKTTLTSNSSKALSPIVPTQAKSISKIQIEQLQTKHLNYLLDNATANHIYPHINVHVYTDLPWTKTIKSDS